MKIKSEFKTKKEATDYLLKRGWEMIWSFGDDRTWFRHDDLGGRKACITKVKNKWYLDR